MKIEKESTKNTGGFRKVTCLVNKTEATSPETTLLLAV